MENIVDIPSEAPDEGNNWEVYRDAFVPPRDTRRPKPWERAPVSAHAPRLQGQKIWKKAGIQAPYNKKDDAAMLELQSEGKGARKKQRVMTAKENIGNPRWKSGFPTPEPLVHDPSIVEAGTGQDGRNTGGEADALQFIPRKRTNTDHVITPRKPLRQTYLNGQAEPLIGKAPEFPAEKPRQKRKSMRRSIRKSTSTKLSESAPTTPRNGVASAIDTAGKSILPALVAEEPPETVSELGTTQDWSPTAQTATREIVKGGEDTGAISNERPGVMETLKIARPGPRNSVLGSAESPDYTAKLSPTVESTEGPLLPYSITHSSVHVDGVLGHDITQQAHDIFTPTTAQESLVVIKSNAVTVESEAPTEVNPASSPTFSLIEHSAQGVVPSVQPVEQSDALNPHSPPTRAKAAPEPLNLSAEPLVLELHTKSIQTAGSDAVELPNSPVDAFVVEKGSKDPPHGSSEQAAEPSSPQVETSSGDFLPVGSPVHSHAKLSPTHTEDPTQQALTGFDPSINVTTEDTMTVNATYEQMEERLQSPTADLSTFELVRSISENAPSGGYDDDADMLRNFLTRVTANKAAKSDTGKPKRKRSLPHSPLGLPLGDIDPNPSPSPKKANNDLCDEFDVGLPPSPSPTKRRKVDDAAGVKNGATEPKAIRRSGRTRLPVVKAPPGAPSLIPVRRLGQDRDATVTLGHSKEKDLVALTRVNTRKNKGAALSPAEVLILKAEEKTDPVLRQRYLKEVFEEKSKGKKSKASKNVAWAEELAQFQNNGEGKAESERGGDKNGAVKAGSGNRAKIAPRKPANGTPAPKRRTRDHT